MWSTVSGSGTSPIAWRVSAACACSQSQKAFTSGRTTLRGELTLGQNMANLGLLALGRAGVGEGLEVLAHLTAKGLGHLGQQCGVADVRDVVGAQGPRQPTD